MVICLFLLCSTFLWLNSYNYRCENLKCLMGQTARCVQQNVHEMCFFLSHLWSQHLQTIRGTQPGQLLAVGKDEGKDGIRQNGVTIKRILLWTRQWTFGFEKRVENFVSEWQSDRKGGRLHEVIPLSEGNIRILYGTQFVSKSAHRNDGSNDAKVTSVTLPLPLWMEQQLRVQNYAITVISKSCVAALALPRTGHLAPSKAERYHGQVKRHQARLNVTMGR